MCVGVCTGRRGDGAVRTRSAAPGSTRRPTRADNSTTTDRRSTPPHSQNSPFCKSHSIESRKATMATLLDPFSPHPHQTATGPLVRRPNSPTHNSTQHPSTRATSRHALPHRSDSRPRPFTHPPLPPRSPLHTPGLSTDPSPLRPRPSLVAPSRISWRRYAMERSGILPGRGRRGHDGRVRPAR